MTSMLPEPVTDTVSSPANPQKRRRLFLILGAVVAKIALGYAWYQHSYASHFVSTDNAYTAAETAQVTPTVAGIVREVHVADTAQVNAGDILVVLDDTDAKLALDQAEAELGRALRRVRGYVANDANLAAKVIAARADLERTKVELNRRQALADSGSVSTEELTKAVNAFDTAKANFAAAEAAREANAVFIAGTTEENNPEVTLMRAKRDQARVNLERTLIRAPVTGVVARRSVQVGQQLQAGSPILSIVPLANVHVDANFKEGQLAKVQIGQRVEIESDLYGSNVKYHGVVIGLSGGTGSTFATIPAQNATGNWIKVVQRLPVRIELDKNELAKRPLQIGLSMTATIDTRSKENTDDRSKKVLSKLN